MPWPTIVYGSDTVVVRSAPGSRLYSWVQGMVSIDSIQA
jgi:hypothetical protein